MKKQLIAAALAAALCLGASPAFAVGEERSPTVNTHPGYADVKEDDWFAPYVSICEEHGLHPQAILDHQLCQLCAVHQNNVLPLGRFLGFLGKVSCGNEKPLCSTSVRMIKLPRTAWNLLSPKPSNRHPNFQEVFFMKKQLIAAALAW